MGIMRCWYWENDDRKWGNGESWGVVGGSKLKANCKYFEKPASAGCKSSRYCQRSGGRKVQIYWSTDKGYPASFAAKVQIYWSTDKGSPVCFAAKLLDNTGKVRGDKCWHLLAAELTWLCFSVPLLVLQNICGLILPKFAKAWGLTVVER